MQEIDAIVIQLRRLRDKLEGDSARVQHHLVNYAALAQSAVQFSES